MKGLPIDETPVPPRQERASAVHGPEDQAIGRLVARERLARTEAEAARRELEDERKRSQQDRDVLLAQLDAEREKVAQLLSITRARDSKAPDASEMHDNREQFLALFSHELRTPLNAILGWSSLLRTGPLSDSSRERAVATIERNAMVLAKLLDDTLEASHVRDSKASLQFRDIELSPLIEAARDSVRAAAEAKEIRIALELDPTTGVVFGDPNRLEQVMWNILSNAIKFTPAKGKVDVRLDKVGETHARIIVRDSGRGIATSFLPRLFEPFRQAETGTTRANGGLGLGLAIVRHLVELHGGTVTAESEGEGKGSSFSILLPIHEVGDSAAHVSLSPDPIGALDGVRVLLVDDEADARELLTAVLERDGAEVAVASTADEAIRMVESWRPDVLVSDIGMPDKDGYELIRGVRALGPERGGDVRAGALTAYAADRDSRHALEAGFQLHVSKPITPSELVSMVGRLERWET